METKDLLFSFDRHHRVVEVAFWSIYLSTNAVVESFSVITEYAHINRPLDAWEPFVWEFSSAILTGILIVAIENTSRQ